MVGVEPTFGSSSHPQPCCPSRRWPSSSLASDAMRAQRSVRRRANHKDRHADPSCSRRAALTGRFIQSVSLIRAPPRPPPALYDPASDLPFPPSCGSITDIHPDKHYTPGSAVGQGCHKPADADPPSLSSFEQLGVDPDDPRRAGRWGTGPSCVLFCSCSLSVLSRGSVDILRARACDVSTDFLVFD